jgi:hypothetical protein
LKNNICSADKVKTKYQTVTLKRINVKVLMKMVKLSPLGSQRVVL